MRTTIMGMLALLALGCGDDEPTQSAVERCREHTPKVQTAVYGCITSTNDVGEPTVDPFPEFGVLVFAEQPALSSDQGPAPVAQTLSDQDGYYELELAAGSYWLCTAFRRCAQISVAAGQKLKQSYEFSGDNWF